MRSLRGMAGNQRILRKPGRGGAACSPWNSPNSVTVRSPARQSWNHNSDPLLSVAPRIRQDWETLTTPWDGWMANSDPVYLRVVEDLRRQIVDGTLPPGAPIPSRHQITRKYGVGETAARHALRVLAGEGLIIGRVGSGHRVRERPILIPLQRGRAPDHHSPFSSDMQASGFRATWHWRSGPIDAPPDIARRLRLPDWEQVIRTRYVFRGDGRPLQLVTSYEQVGFTEGLESEEGTGER